MTNAASWWCDFLALQKKSTSHFHITQFNRSSISKILLNIDTNCSAEIQDLLFFLRLEVSHAIIA